MASQQLDAMPVVPDDQRMQSPTSHNSALVEHLPANQHLIDVGQMLYSMSGILHTARDSLSSISDYAKTHQGYEFAYHEERKRRIECAQQYEELHVYYTRVVNDLCGMHKERDSLHQQLQNAEEVIHNLESVIQEQRAAGSGNDVGIGQSDWDRVEWALERELLQTRVTELENEKSRMAQDHQNALANAADHIRAVAQRADELEKLQEASAQQILPLVADQNSNENDDNTATPKPTGRAGRARKRKAPAK